MHTRVGLNVIRAGFQLQTLLATCTGLYTALRTTSLRLRMASCLAYATQTQGLILADFFRASLRECRTFVGTWAHLGSGATLGWVWSFVLPSEKSSDSPQH